MVSTSHTGQATGMPVGRAMRRRYSLAVRRLRSSDVAPALVLGASCVLIGLAQYVTSYVPLTTLVIPMVIGNLLLTPRTLPWLVVLTLGILVLVTAATPALLDGRRIGGIVVIFLIGLIILVSSFRRTSLGVAGVRGETMLVDLRDRIQHQARIPALPKTWYAEAILRSAGGSSFAGDFMVASKSPDGRHLQVAVVDVSGKGEQAGPRSLLLSGAFGGLLGALPADQFLPAANAYLLRQDWGEGFATAVHTALDLETGGFEIRSAGHPPAVQLLSSTEQWAIHEAEGPVLGLMAEPDFTVVSGFLEQGDALLLFTDGLVETPQRDVSIGIDKLLGQGELLMRDGFENGARRLIDRLESHDDDRALLLIHRRPD